MSQLHFTHVLGLGLALGLDWVAVEMVAEGLA